MANNFKILIFWGGTGARNIRRILVTVILGIYTLQTLFGFISNIMGWDLVSPLVLGVFSWTQLFGLFTLFGFIWSYNRTDGF